MHPFSERRIGFIPLWHVAVAIACAIRLQLGELFIPCFIRSTRLKPDRSQTRLSIALECAIFDSSALTLHPCSERRIGFILVWHVAVAIACIIRLQLGEIFIPYCS